MEDETKSVVLQSFNSPEIAAMVVSALEAEGMHAFVKGALLQDPIAVARRSMNVQGVEVFVRAGDLERARTVLQEMREAGKNLADEEDPTTA